MVTAAGLRWSAPRLPRGMTLLSFEVAYSWQSCAPSGQHCVTGADSAATPFAARRYVVGHADTGRRLRVTETASEVVQTQRSPFTFQVIRRSVSRLAAAAVRAYPRHEPPATAFVNGTPERHTASTEEYFQVAAPHENAADGRAAQWYRVDGGRWHALPASPRLLHRHARARAAPGGGAHRQPGGATEIRFGWQVDPPSPPLPCQPSGRTSAGTRRTWTADQHPMRWDWQIGRATPLQRTGRQAVDIYDLDGFLTTRAQVRAIRTTWQASTLRAPADGLLPGPGLGGLPPRRQPRRALLPGRRARRVYYGYPEERWTDLRQLDALQAHAP